VTTLQDQIEKALVDRFKANELDLEIEWERVEAYAIDDACRMKAAAIGLVDQGQRFDSRTGLQHNTWRMAVEFFVRCNVSEDIKTKTNLARACIFRTMMTDTQLGNLLLDCRGVEDMVFVDRENKYGEGVMVFDLLYRTPIHDISVDIA
jgi:hypothetical protein